MARKIPRKKLNAPIKPIEPSQRLVTKWTLNTDN